MAAVEQARTRPREIVAQVHDTLACDLPVTIFKCSCACCIAYVDHKETPLGANFREHIVAQPTGN